MLVPRGLKGRGAVFRDSVISVGVGWSHPPPWLPSGTVISHRSAAASFPALLWLDARTPSRSSAKARGFALPEFERMATTFPRVGGMSSLLVFSARLRSLEPSRIRTYPRRSEPTRTAGAVRRDRMDARGGVARRYDGSIESHRAAALTSQMWREHQSRGPFLEASKGRHILPVNLPRLHCADWLDQPAD